jgi:hypothetical protein
VSAELVEAESMNETIRWRDILRAALLIALLITQHGCEGNKAGPASTGPALTWNSPKMRDIEKEWHALWEACKAKPKDHDKFVDGRDMMLTNRLLRTRLSHVELRQLAATSDSLPIVAHDKDRGPFVNDVLQFMVRSFVKVADRESLVELLSKRCPSQVNWSWNIEYCLVYRGWRLKDPILVLGEAYSKCQVPETRHTLAAAVRRGFAGLGIHRKDEAEFVSNAMSWYEEHKGGLVANERYYLNECTGGSFTVENLERHPEYYDNPPERIQPLFEPAASASPRESRVAQPVAILWPIHAAIAAILAGPIVLLGRKRVHWQRWELLALVAPYGIWAALMISRLSDDRANFGKLTEAFYLAPAVAIAALLRIGIGARVREQLVAISLIAVLCGAAVAMFFLVPPLLALD